MVKFRKNMCLSISMSSPVIWAENLHLSVCSETNLTKEQLISAVEEVLTEMKKQRIPYVEKDAEEQFAALLAKLHPAWDIEISTCWDVCANEGRVKNFGLTKRMVTEYG